MAKSYKYKRSRKPLTLEQCKLRMTDAIKELEIIILSDNKPYLKIQAIHALGSIIAKYESIVETTELIDRIEALETKNNLRKVS
jgi:hypothetical protein